jgi:DNA-binding CsgD family transcriptional regulator
MTKMVLRAIAALQQRSFLTRAISVRELELLERTLDKLARNPNQSGDEFRIVRNGLADARKILARRRQLLPLSDLDTARTMSSSGEKVSELREWLARTPALLPDDRQLLQQLAEGASADDIAREFKIPVKLARVRISRARARARKAWGAP